MPLSGRIPSDQSKSSQWWLHLPLLRWPVADPGRCVKNIPAWDQDWTPSSLVFLETRFLRSPARHPDEPCRGLDGVGDGGSFCRWEGWRAGWHPSLSPAVALLARSLGDAACLSGAAWKMGAQEQLPMGRFGLHFKPGASSGAGCPAGFDWLQLASLLLVCSLLGCFWKACLFDLSASFLMLSFSSAASFPLCKRNRGSLKSLCPLGFQVTFHLFNLSLKPNARTSFQKKKSKNRAFLSFYDVAWFLATTPRYLFDSYKSGTQSNARTNHVQEFPWDIALSFFPFSLLHSRSEWHNSGYWK